jgi:hypothetical protein
MVTVSSYSSCKAENGGGKLHFANFEATERYLEGIGLKRGLEDAGTDGK